MSIATKSYARNPLTVEAFQYNGERIDLLPEWAKAHQGHTAMGGVTPIGKDVTGQLLVPINGHVETVRYGDYLTFVPTETGGVVAVFKKAIFEAEFTVIEEVLVASEAPAPEAVVTTDGPLDIPTAVEPAAETTAPAKAKKGAATTADEPATEA